MSYDPRPAFGQPVGGWFETFAWLPVRTYNQRLVWFRKVMARCVQKHHYLHGGADFWFQYKVRGE